MTEDVKKIKEELENTYDIPFTVREDRLNGEPSYCMGPQNEEKKFFFIRVSFSNGIRLNADFVPETYSADFIRSMSNRPEADRETFLQFVSLMKERGAKVKIEINNNEVSSEEFKNYPNNWSQFSVRTTKIPISEEQHFSYTEKALEWGSIMIGMILSMADVISLEDDVDAFQTDGYAEGGKTKAVVNKYERNPINRKLCLEKSGYRCCVCGMDFEETYGPIGQKFIHVHHIIPVSQIGENYIINPMKDLVPVCPNCHAMLHEKNPPYTPGELRTIMHNRDYTNEGGKQ